MKKLLALLFSAILLCTLCACGEGADILNPYFTGKVLEKQEGGCLLEVTDRGNQTFAEGESVYVTTAIEGCPDIAVGDLLTVSFDGKIAESYPMQILNVYQIAKTEGTGTE